LNPWVEPEPDPHKVGFGRGFNFSPAGQTRNPKPEEKPTRPRACNFQPSPRTRVFKPAPPATPHTTLSLILAPPPLGFFAVAAAATRHTPSVPPSAVPRAAEQVRHQTPTPSPTPSVPRAGARSSHRPSLAQAHRGEPRPPAGRPPTADSLRVSDPPSRRRAEAPDGRLPPTLPRAGASRPPTADSLRPSLVQARRWSELRPSSRALHPSLAASPAKDNKVMYSRSEYNQDVLMLM
jgi:hypothetical protein